MITGRNNTLKWLETFTEQGFPYWTIYHKGRTDSGHHVFKSSQADDLTMADSLQDLRRKLDILGYGQYTIIAQSKAGNIGKGAAKEDFEITTSEAQAPAQNISIGSVQSMSGYVTKEEANEMAQKMFQELMLKKENEDLKTKLQAVEKEKKDLEKEAESGTNRVINMIAGIVEPMLKPQLAQVGTLGINAPATTAPASDQEATEPTAEQIELGNRLQKVLAECETIFGEPAIPFLERLMEKVKAQPYLVTMVKSALA